MNIYNSYQEYLQSPEWQVRRKRILRRDGYQCDKCGSPVNVEVHHIKYPEVWGTEKDTDLVTLCARCHGAMHANNWRKKYESMQRAFVNEVKKEDFLFGGHMNMCVSDAIRDRLRDFCERNNFEVSVVTQVQGVLGYAHWLLISRMLARGYTTYDIRLATPLEAATIQKQIGCNREYFKSYMIPFEEIDEAVERYIENDQKRRTE